jgi:lipopolysaccharide export system permease protein
VKIVDRYMIKGFLWPFLWCIVMFEVMAIIIDIFSFIDYIVKYKIAASSILSFYVYYSPTILLQVTPMAALLSTIYLLSNLNKNNEITAMRSSGISLWRILAPILLVGLIVSILTFLINDRIIPISSRTANTIRREELEKESKKYAQQGRFLENVAVYGVGNRIIFARTYDREKKELGDVIIHQHDEAENLTSKTTAQKAVWTGHGWRFYKVIRYKIDNSGKILGEPKFFDDIMIPIREKPNDFATREWNSDYMSYRELKRYIRNFRGAGAKMLRSLAVDLHYKVAFPLISLIIILIGAPFALVTTRGGVLLGLGMSIVIGLLYYATIAMALAFGKGGVLHPAVAAWLGNVSFGILGVWLINKRA